MIEMLAEQSVYNYLFHIKTSIKTTRVYFSKTISINKLSVFNESIVREKKKS